MLAATHQEAGALADAYVDARRTTESICAPLKIEDYVVQAMADASPAKWHLGHVSWFFETFLLMPNVTGYQPRNPQYQYLFNSYYNGVGPQFSRPHRGHLSRPTVAEVYRYRRHVDEEMVSLIETTSPEQLETLGPVMELGVNHEQQHQELLITDIKYNLSVNPLRPAYHDLKLPRGARRLLPAGWTSTGASTLWGMTETASHSTTSGRATRRTTGPTGSGPASSPTVNTWS